MLGKPCSTHTWRSDVLLLLCVQWRAACFRASRRCRSVHIPWEHCATRLQTRRTAQTLHNTHKGKYCQFTYHESIVLHVYRRGGRHKRSTTLTKVSTVSSHTMRALCYTSTDAAGGTNAPQHSQRSVLSVHIPWEHCATRLQTRRTAQTLHNTHKGKYCQFTYHESIVLHVYRRGGRHKRSTTLTKVSTVSSHTMRALCYTSTDAADGTNAPQHSQRSVLSVHIPWEHCATRLQTRRTAQTLHNTHKGQYCQFTYHESIVLHVYRRGGRHERSTTLTKVSTVSSHTVRALCYTSTDAAGGTNAPQHSQR